MAYHCTPSTPTANGLAVLALRFSDGGEEDVSCLQPLYANCPCKQPDFDPSFNPASDSAALTGLRARFQRAVTATS